jgi:hypothetical protein
MTSVSTEARAGLEIRLLERGDRYHNRQARAAILHPNPEFY